jgi:hypothetical protein
MSFNSAMRGEQIVCVSYLSREELADGNHPQGVSDEHGGDGQEREDAGGVHWPPLGVGGQAAQQESHSS